MKRLTGTVITSAFVVFAMIFSAAVYAADRSSNLNAGRVGMAPRASISASRNIPAPAPTPVAPLGSGMAVPVTLPAVIQSADNLVVTGPVESTDSVGEADSAALTPGTNCRDVYRDCMDQFCLLDESEGGRCICSDNIYASKTKIAEINEIIAAAQKLNTEGVERELAGARVGLIFGADESGKTKKKSIDYIAWLNGDDNTAELNYDDMVGAPLYDVASESCADRLALCGKDATMEELLYSRVITGDCRNFATYLDEQKKFEEDNKFLAERAVRAARTKMLETTNKYNRGECLIAYRSCIADKGGCGVNFENCLDANLLARRANACDNVLDQCTAVRNYVLQDWAAESQMVLAEAAKYAEQNRLATCRARTWACLEESCGTSYGTDSSTSAQCLNNVNVAAGICPVIQECNEMVPGYRAGIADELKSLRLRFCQNDINRCLQDRCGANYTNPECIGKKPNEILAMCPQSMFSTCVGQDKKQYNAIVSAALLEMDYSMMEGCVNYFSEQLGRVCGTDMACLPIDSAITNMKSTSDKVDWRAGVDAAVEEFFTQFEQDKTVVACADAAKPLDRLNMGSIVFNTAKMLARYQAEDRAFRAYTAKMAELSRSEDLDSARQNCDALFDELKKSNSSTSRNEKEPGVWVISHSFEPALRNCSIVKVQKVCEIGGEDEATSAVKMGAGGLAAGAAAGTMAAPVWGTAIGAAVGLVGGIIGGAVTGGEEANCQEIQVTEDVNM